MKLNKSFKRVYSFILGSCLIYIFSFIFLPYLSKALNFEEAHNKIIEEKIEAGAWYYIFVEKAEPSANYINNKIKY